ncbi:MAG: molybdopterin-dependent oxidoreductase [Candidatus Zixiibacteriota bacterium]
MSDKKLKCQFCSLQDDIYINELSSNDKKDAFCIDYDSTKSGVCARGHLMAKLYSHPNRIKEPLLSNERASYGLAIESLSRMLDKNTAFLLGPSLTLEDALSAIKFSKELGSDFVSLAIPEDETVSFLMNRFSFESFNDSNLVIIVGDVLSTHPTISRYFLSFFKNENKSLVVIDNHETVTSGSADLFLQILPGQVGAFIKELVRYNNEEWSNLDKYRIDKSEIESFTDLMNDAKNPIILFSNNFGHFYQPERIGYQAQKLAQSLGDSHNFAYLPIGSNSRGIYRLLRQNDMKKLPETLKAIESGKVSKIVMLQTDITEAVPAIDLFNIESIIQSTLLPTAITPYCHIVLPGLLLGEKKGTLLTLEEKLERLNPIKNKYNILQENRIFSGMAGILNGITQKEIAEILKSYRQPPKKSGTFFAINKPVYIGFSEPFHHSDGSLTRSLLQNDTDKFKEKLSLKKAMDNPVITDFDQNDEKSIIMTPVHIPEFRRLFTRKFEPGIMQMKG